MTTLTMGANAPLSQNKLTLKIDLQGPPADVIALQIYDTGKVRGDGDMCFYNQTTTSNGGLTLTVLGTQHNFDVDLDKIPSDVQKLIFTAALDTQTIGDAQSLSVKSTDGHEFDIPTQGRSEKALIIGEIYKRNGAWKIKNIGQGFNGGLQNLAEHYGVDIAGASASPAPTPPSAAPTPPPAPTPQPTPRPEAKPLNLTKISLTKQESTLSLTKADGRFGKISINLNWNQQQKKGFFGKSKGIDLDLGAFIEFKDGNRTAVQALGDVFGDYNRAPYVLLDGDDRSGAVSDGEWLHINGDKWPEFSRVLIYAFIYEGAPNWRETDGYIRMHVPGQPKVEVQMNEYAGNTHNTMCAVALLENINGEIKVSREVQFFPSHSQMNDTYRWGLRFKAGRK